MLAAGSASSPGVGEPAGRLADGRPVREAGRRGVRPPRYPVGGRPSTETRRRTAASRRGHDCADNVDSAVAAPMARRMPRRPVAWTARPTGCPPAPMARRVPRRPAARTARPRPAPGTRAVYAPAMSDPDCLFCKIAAGEIPATVVREDERTIAFMDINPPRAATRWSYRAHTPATCGRSIPTISRRCAAAAQDLARRVRDRLGAEGVNLLNSCGEAAWQTRVPLPSCTSSRATRPTRCDCPGRRRPGDMRRGRRGGS